MKTKKSLLFFMAAAVMLAFVAGDLSAQVPRTAPKRIVQPSNDPQFGYVPPPIDLSHIQPSPFLTAPLAPASWDWRAMSGVSSVKNQNPYGTCWTFAALGNLESQVLLGEFYEPDYSELNIVSCNPTSNDCNAGGNSWMTTNYLSLLGSVEESCDTYPGGCPTPSCINPACSYLKQVTEWRLVPNDVEAIKTAVMTYGPAYTSFYASFPGFSSYDGSYCLTYAGTEDPNHAVLIVGWDDAMCSGNGAWIVKNSWGTGWGDNGYFYIQYGSARIGSNTNVITGYRDYDPAALVHHYDEWGWWSAVGYGDGNDYAVVEIDPATSDYLTQLHFWATASPTIYTITVYDDFAPAAGPSNPIAGPFTGTATDAGYYTIELATPIPVGTGDEIYIHADLNTGAYGYPVPYDDSGPMENGKCYISNDDATWNDLGGTGYAMGDIGLRATIGPIDQGSECFKEGDPAFYVDFGETARDVIAGETVCWTVGPCNFGFVSATCPDTDTFCVDVEETQNWIVTGDPPLRACNVLDPGYLWWQDICVTVPCDVSVCDYDTVTAVMSYCDAAGFCAADCGDCEDPNFYGGDPYYSTITVVLHVVESPPALYILQDSLYLVEQGQTAAYIP
ncbi:MAG: hypothetical protein JW876_10145, partial [Candidatus Krumholzibacteriota bacterium]|nr:hypothetical protein [Candidatus Krumholzibacteriota bacterium]